MKYLELCQKYSAPTHTFNSLVRVSSGDETLCLILDILLDNPSLAMTWHVTSQKDICVGSWTLNDGKPRSKRINPARKIIPSPLSYISLLQSPLNASQCLEGAPQFGWAFQQRPDSQDLRINTPEFIRLKTWTFKFTVNPLLSPLGE